MAKYECNLCGMSVKTNCGHCDAPLVNAMLDLDDGTQVQISQCQKSELLAPISLDLAILLFCKETWWFIEGPN